MVSACRQDWLICCMTLGLLIVKIIIVVIIINNVTNFNWNKQETPNNYNDKSNKETKNIVLELSSPDA